jgi:hypothetical protein
MTIWWKCRKLSYSVEGRGIALEGPHYHNFSLPYTWRPAWSSIGSSSSGGGGGSGYGGGGVKILLIW